MVHVSVCHTVELQLLIRRYRRSASAKKHIPKPPEEAFHSTFPHAVSMQIPSAPLLAARTRISGPASDRYPPQTPIQGRVVLDALTTRAV